MTANTFCRACGAKQEPDARFCNACGATVAAPPAPAEGSKVVAASPLHEKGGPAQAGLHRSSQPLVQELITKMGNRLRVSTVKHGSQAEQLGIKVGDYLISYNGVPVSSNPELSNAVFAAKNEGVETTAVVILRDGEKLIFEASLGQLGLNCEEISEKLEVLSSEAAHEYEAEYSVSRMVSLIVAFIGWAIVLAGIIVVFGAVTSDTKTILGTLSMVAILPGVGAVITGFVLILWAQALQAAVDSADHTREIMKLLYRKMT